MKENECCWVLLKNVHLGIVAKTIFHELGAEQRNVMGIDDSLIRLSGGIEDSQDLLDDFTQVLC